MKKIIFVFLFAYTSHIVDAQQKLYYPAANNCEHKSLVSEGIDSVKLQEAINYAINNETKAPKNLWLTQAIQFGKEPRSLLPDIF